jgi:transcriptional regulator with XRE-family HTH domain
MPTHKPEQRNRIIELWRDDWSLGEIGTEIGVSRQRVSQILLAAGFSPALRRAERVAENGMAEDAFKRQRAETIARRNEEREAARVRLSALAAAFDVRPLTLAMHADRNGIYAEQRKGTGYMYGTGKLPPRDTPEGRKLAARVKAAAAPWSAVHLARTIRA